MANWLLGGAKPSTSEGHAVTEQVVPRQLHAADFDLDFDWTRPVDRPFVAPKRRRLQPKQNPFVDTIGKVHAADNAAVVIAIDLAVLSVVSVGLAILPVWFRLGYPFAAVIASYLGRVYVERDSVQTRGVLWFPGRIVAPLSAVAALPVALGVVHVAHGDGAVPLVVQALQVGRHRFAERPAVPDLARHARQPPPRRRSAPDAARR